MGRVQAGVYVKTDLDIREGSSNSTDLFHRQLHRLPRFQYAVPIEVVVKARRLRLMPADEFPAAIHVRLAVVNQLLESVAVDVWVTHNLVPDRSTQQLVDRHVHRLAFDVPQGDVNGANSASVNRVSWEEVGPEHLLPELLGRPWVLADHDLRQVGDSRLDGVAPVSYTDLAQAVYTGVRLHLDDEVTTPVAILDRVRLDCADFQLRLLVR